MTVYSEESTAERESKAKDRRGGDKMVCRTR